MKRARQSSNDGYGAMEYFLLALIGRLRLTSLYALQQQAGLQPGGIRPALNRLEDSGLIVRGESGRRMRRDFSLTERGTTFLNDNWKQCLVDYSDSESILRAACVALLMYDAGHAVDYLLRQSQINESKGKEKNMEAEHLMGRQHPLSIYAAMRALTEAQRREGESKAFSQLGRTLKEKYQPNDVQPR